MCTFLFPIRKNCEKENKHGSSLPQGGACFRAFKAARVSRPPSSDLPQNKSRKSTAAAPSPKSHNFVRALSTSNTGGCCIAREIRISNHSKSHTLPLRIFEMFSPSVPAAQQASIRTSRRRHRTSDSIADQPSSKRQRSALSNETFLPPDAQQEKQDTMKKTALANLALVSQGPGPGPRTEIAVRAKKSRAADRANKGDGSTILVCATIIVNDVELINFRLPTIHILSASFLHYQIAYVQMPQVNLPSA